MAPAVRALSQHVVVRFAPAGTEHSFFEFSGPALPVSISRRHVTAPPLKHTNAHTTHGHLHLHAQAH
jgi:hypothetical protein